MQSNAINVSIISQVAQPHTLRKIFICIKERRTQTIFWMFSFLLFFFLAGKLKNWNFKNKPKCNIRVDFEKISSEFLGQTLNFFSNLWVENSAMRKFQFVIWKYKMFCTRLADRPYKMLVIFSLYKYFFCDPL